MGNNTCSSCGFFAPIGGSGKGQCRRFPPLVQAVIVGGDYWCGEWAEGLPIEPADYKQPAKKPSLRQRVFGK